MYQSLTTKTTGRLKDLWSRGSSRVVIQVEVVALLLGSVALTVMPLETMRTLQNVSAWAEQLALQHRPVVALVGLLSVGVFTWLIITLTRAVTVDATAAKERDHGRDERATLRRAA